MSFLWVAFILLILGALIGTWCLVSSLYGATYWRSKDDPTDAERKFACIGSVILFCGAVAFAVAALLHG